MNRSVSLRVCGVQNIKMEKLKKLIKSYMCCFVSWFYYEFTVLYGMGIDVAVAYKVLQPFQCHGVFPFQSTNRYDLWWFQYQQTVPFALKR